MSELQVIPIVFSANEKYAPYIAVTITSIIKNSNSDFYYQFYVLQTELSQNMVLRLEGISGKNFGLICVDVNDWCSGSMYSSAYFSTEMYFRLFIPELFPEYKKVIYLDCDTVVLGDISELYQNEFENELLGGMRNLMHAKMRKYVKIALGLNEDTYINSGVLLFNCEQCRNENYTKKAFEYLETRKDLIYPDQDLINITCENRIKLLDPKWNFTWHYRHLQLSQNSELHLSDEDMGLFCEYEKDPKLIHYTGEIKPWSDTNKFLSDIFWEYAKESVFFNLFLKRLALVHNTEMDNGIRNRLERLEKVVKKIEANQHSSNNNSNIVENINRTANSVNFEKEQIYLVKYNDVIGSFSYKFGRMLTFPFRKMKDTFVLLRDVGLRKTLKQLPVKMRLYKNIILRRNS